MKASCFQKCSPLLRGFFWLAGICAVVAVEAPKLLPKPGLYKSLTEPPCSYASTQHRKGLVRSDDRVLAWIRGSHNGGAIPIRLFLSAPRVINDTYGLFFYDPDGGYVSAFKKDNGYEFFGWRGGVMVAKGRDGTLWSALTGRGLEGPKKGSQLERLPSLVTDWGYWLMLHPESTAYDLFDGKKYPLAELPVALSPEAKATIGVVDARLKPQARVLGVELGELTKTFPLDAAGERACFGDKIGTESIAVFWYGPTKTAVAFKGKLKNRALTFYADAASPETAPFKDKETGTRWTIAGRAVDGELKGEELEWVPGVQCNWYAWSAEYPATLLYEPSK